MKIKTNDADSSATSNEQKDSYTQAGVNLALNRMFGLKRTVEKSDEPYNLNADMCNLIDTILHSDLNDYQKSIGVQKVLIGVQLANNALEAYRIEHSDGEEDVEEKIVDFGIFVRELENLMFDVDLPFSHTSLEMACYLVLLAKELSTGIWTTIVNDAAEVLNDRNRNPEEIYLLYNSNESQDNLISKSLFNFYSYDLEAKTFMTYETDVARFVRTTFK